MNRILYPFSAIVGATELKLALMLGAVDWRLSVLLRGDKGSGKSTAARGFADLLPDASPFMNLPLGATEDRLLGGLDLGRTMKGDPSLKPGLLAEAHGGVVYVDEINLLPDHLGDSLLDVAAGGVMFMEREGFSTSQECRFLLLGSMNPEEGGLRPQLLDRFALVVDVQASVEPEQRRCIVERRLRFEADPKTFLIEWKSEQQQLQTRLREARAAAQEVICPPEILDWISRTVCEHNARSLRADLALVRAGIACAALDASMIVARQHVEEVLPLVLGHRAKPMPPPSGGRPSTNVSSRDPGDTTDQEQTMGERIFVSRPVEAPRLLKTQHNATAANARGAVIGSRRNEDPVELDGRGSVIRAVAQTGSPIPRIEDLQEKLREAQCGTRFLFVVDSSGSHGVKDRMRLVKGAVAGLLKASSRRHEEICVVAFRGTSADVVMEPTRDSEFAIQALEYLPTGGRTPLASGLELALQYVTPFTVMVILTDGRANVPSRSADAWADALIAAESIRCPALVVNTEDKIGATGRPVALAEAMRATHIRLEDLDTAEQLILTIENLC